MDDLFKRIVVSLLANEYKRVTEYNRVSAAAWRKKNPERSRESVRNSANRHPETKRRCAKARQDRIKGNAQHLAKQRDWYRLHKDEIALQRKANRLANPEKFKAWQAKYLLNNRHRKNEAKRIRDLNRTPEQIERDRTSGREYARRKSETDVFFRLRRSFGVKVSTVLQGRQTSKSFAGMIGCSKEELMAHLESQFQPAMSWANYGKFGWHVDHIKPVSSFNLADYEEVKKCWHFSNLQPMWWRDNIVKGNKATVCDTSKNTP